jgi:hypothetical protein
MMNVSLRVRRVRLTEDLCKGGGAAGGRVGGEIEAVELCVRAVGARE